MKYRKKPVVIDAIQYTGENKEEIENFVGKKLEIDNITHPSDVYLVIPTLEGKIFASVNDFIIRGVQGEFYPCKADIFAETYEPAE